MSLDEGEWHMCADRTLQQQDGENYSLTATEARFRKKMFQCAGGVISLWACTFIIILIFNDAGKSGQFSDSFGALNTLFTGLAFSAVVVALFIQRDDLATSLHALKISAEAQQKISEEALKDRSERYASIYEKFSSQGMKEARSVFWALAISDWFNDPEYRAKLTYFAIRSSKDQEAINKDAYMCSDIISFYAYLYDIFKDDKTSMKNAAEEFFYHWWRGFLLSYVLKSLENWNALCDTPEKKAQLPFHSDLQNILELDKSATDRPFIQQDHPLYSKIPFDMNMYPGLEEHNKSFQSIGAESARRG